MSLCDTGVSQAAKDVSASQDVLIDLFTRIDNFIMRLESYKDIPPNHAMMDMIVKIMVEVIFILSIATAEITQGRRSERIPSNLLFLSYISSGRYLNRLLGKSDIEGALKRLDTLTQEEARMAIAEVLKVTHMMDDKIRLLIDGAQNIVLLIHAILNDLCFSDHTAIDGSSRGREMFVIS